MSDLSDAMFSAFDAESETAPGTDCSDFEDDDDDYLYMKNKPMLADDTHPLMLTFTLHSYDHLLKVFSNAAHEFLSKPKGHILMVPTQLDWEGDNINTYIVDPDQFTEGDEICCSSEWMRYLLYIKLDEVAALTVKNAMKQHSNHIKTILKLGYADTPEEFEALMKFDAKVRENFGRDYSCYGENEYAEVFGDVKRQ